MLFMKFYEWVTIATLNLMVFWHLFLYVFIAVVVLFCLFLFLHPVQEPNLQQDSN